MQGMSLRILSKDIFYLKLDGIKEMYGLPVAR